MHEEQYSATEHHGATIFQSDHEEALTAMVSVYFDDSGTDPESDIAVASCYAGRVEQWEALERDWQDARTVEGFTLFGTADILGGKGEFRSWPQEKRDRLIRRLITMMQTRSRHGWSYSVVKSEYDEAMSDKLKGKVGRFHYSFVVRNCLTGLSAWRKKFNVSEPMKYVFDEMSQGKGEIIAILEQTIRAGSGVACGLYPGGYSFQSKKSVVPLQGADILAHESYRHMVKCIASPNPVPHSMADDYTWELAQAPLTTKYYTKEILVDLARRITIQYDKIGWGLPLTDSKGPKARGKAHRRKNEG